MFSQPSIDITISTFRTTDDNDNDANRGSTQCLQIFASILKKYCKLLRNYTTNQTNEEFYTKPTALLKLMVFSTQTLILICKWYTSHFVLAHVTFATQSKTQKQGVLIKEGYSVCTLVNSNNWCIRYPLPTCFSRSIIHIKCLKSLQAILPLIYQN